MPVLNEMPPTTFSVADIGPLTAAHTPAFTEVDHVTTTDFCGKKNKTTAYDDLGIVTK